MNRCEQGHGSSLTITAMQVPGYRHLKVDDDSGGSGNPYDVRPRPKESKKPKKNQQKTVVDIYSIREPEIKRAGAKRLRPLDGVIVVSENLRGTPSIKLQIEIWGSPSPGGRQRARRSPLFFFCRRNSANWRVSASTQVEASWNTRMEQFDTKRRPFSTFESMRWMAAAETALSANDGSAPLFPTGETFGGWH